MGSKPNDRNAMAIELAGTSCRCGKTKVRGQTLCGDCYYRLPRINRQRLYQDFGRGYEAAYRDAAKLLDNRKGAPK